MKMFGTFLGLVFGVTFLLALLAGGFLLFKYVGGVFATLEPQVETLAAIASVVAVLCTLIIAEGLKARGQQKPLIAPGERAKIYERLLAICCDQLKTPGKKDYPEYPELVPLERALALHAGAKVISAYVSLRSSAKHHPMGADAVAPLLDKLVHEMRTDLGRRELIRGGNDLLDLLLDVDRRHDSQRPQS